jgi:hypothetical protein
MERDEKRWYGTGGTARNETEGREETEWDQ